ncbi:hypothetical protein [Alkalicoccobacillus porphyridii]|nr:hypothetical protein [Alkalicoccobacillus porphyridii]
MILTGALTLSACGESDAGDGDLDVAFLAWLPFTDQAYVQLNTD